jgi:hypothetical protein
MRLFVLPILAPALLKDEGLALLRKTGYEVCVTRGDAFLNKGLRNIGNELQERQPCVDMACAFTRLHDQSGNVVAGNGKQTLEALRLLAGVNVYALRVLDLSLVLQKLSMTYTTMDYQTSWNLYL